MATITPGAYVSVVSLNFLQAYLLFEAGHVFFLLFFLRDFGLIIIHLFCVRMFCRKIRCWRILCKGLHTRTWQSATKKNTFLKIMFISFFTFSNTLCEGNVKILLSSGKILEMPKNSNKGRHFGVSDKVKKLINLSIWTL